MTAASLAGFSLSLEQIGALGGGLSRPECVLATRAGNLYLSDARGGVAWLAPDGGFQFFGQMAAPEDSEFKPNGIALCRDGSFLFANQGAAGGVWRLGRDGEITPYLLEVEGVALPPTNFVLVDEAERVWITVSTRRRERHHFRNDTADGFLILVDGRGARIAADGFIWTNECRFHPGGEWLYVNETFGQRLSRFRVAADGALSERETVTELGPGTFPDGIAFDAEGGAWITGVISNRVIRVTPDGGQQLIVEDLDPAHLEWIEGLLARHELRGPHVHVAKAEKLMNLSSLAFGGADLKTAYLGTLSGESVLTFAAPVAGAPLAHWDWK
jgi:sugar lactone lactonase YvrE